MPPTDISEAFSDAVVGKIDELKLELRKEEKKTKPPIAIYKIILIYVGTLLITSAIGFGIVQIIVNNSTEPTRDFGYWTTVIFLMLGGLGFFAGGVSGVWGGQRNVPIRMVSPIDSSVIGKGLFVTGYTIENCLDNEIELTIYGKDKEVVHEELVPITEGGLFYTKIAGVFEEEKKSKHLIFETWMVSLKSKRLKIVVKKKKLDELNVAKKGLTIGNFCFFSLIYKDFTDKVKTIFDPKRIEKGVIENVKINKQKTTNIFFPTKQQEDGYVPFSYEKISEMRLNAFYFDIKRRRRLLYGLFFFIMSILYLLPAIIFAAI